MNALRRAEHAILLIRFAKFRLCIKRLPFSLAGLKLFLGLDLFWFRMLIFQM